MSTTPPDEPTGTPGATPPPSGPDYGSPPPPGPGYGATPPPPGGYGPPPGGYGPPPGGYGPPPPGGQFGGPAAEPWSLGNALTYGWTKLTRNFWPIIGLTLIVFAGVLVIGVVGNIIELAVTDDRTGFWGRQLVSGLVSLLGFLVQTVLSAVVVRAALDLTEGRGIDVGAIFRRLPVGPVIVLGVLNAVIFAVGILLCFLPGIVALFFLSYSTYFLLDRDLSPVEAIKASFVFVGRNLGTALVWAVVAFIVTLLGLCLCGIGLLVSLPLATIGTAYTYKKLNGQPVAP